MPSPISEQLELYLQFFRGRKDIYALKWEKGERSGWSPAYKVDWQEFNIFRAKGGSLKDFKNKGLIPLNRKVLRSHLEGNVKLGMYPLLDDNSSYFIAADFDKKNWQDECFSFYNTCNDFGLHAYIEKSSSGNGGHVWIFFEETYPALKSRGVILELLRRALALSWFEKEISFDRLFPNQDFHGNNQGYGNLIALPFNGKLMEYGNTSFLNPKTFEPYTNQWDFLKNVKKTSTKKLDKLYEDLCSENSDQPLTDLFKDSVKHESALKNPKLESTTFDIVLKNQIYLYKDQLNGSLVRFLREELNFNNNEYLLKKKFRKSVYKVEKYFNLIDEKSNLIMLPRGFLKDLIQFCSDKKIEYQIKDERKKLKETIFHSHIELRDYQEDALAEFENKDFGVLVSPPGSGKTIMGLQLVAERKQSTLIIVHRKQLLDQWIDRIESFLKIPPKDIGIIASNKHKIGKQITVAMIQSLGRMSDFSEFENQFGLILVDECHHVPAKTFRQVIKQFSAYYLYGLTATPKRKNNDEKLIFVYIGNIITTVNTDRKNPLQTDPHIKIRSTNFKLPFDYKFDNPQLLLKMVTFDTQRNQEIIEDVLLELKNDRKILILTERIDHIEVLNLYLKNQCEIITISGSDSARTKK